MLCCILVVSHCANISLSPKFEIPCCAIHHCCTRPSLRMRCDRKSLLRGPQNFDSLSCSAHHSFSPLHSNLPSLQEASLPLNFFFHVVSNVMWSGVLAAFSS